MEQYEAPRDWSELQERVRELGFDPSHLSPQEWAEVVEIHTLFADETVGT